MKNDNFKPSVKDEAPCKHKIGFAYDACDIWYFIKNMAEWEKDHLEDERLTLMIFNYCPDCGVKL